MESGNANAPARLRIGQTSVLDMENNYVLTDAASDVSASTFQIGYLSNTKLFVCKYCNKTLKSKGGLTIHMHKMHEKNFHANNIPEQRVKARWDDEKLVLLAREELELVRKGVRNVNQELMKVLPHRSLQSIKGVRRSSNKKYQNLLLEFRSEPIFERDVVGEEEPAQGGVHPEMNEFCGQGLITVNDFADRHHESWWARLKAEIVDSVFLGGLDVGLLQPNCLTDEVRQVN